MTLALTQKTNLCRRGRFSPDGLSIHGRMQFSAHRQFHNLPEGMDPGLAAFDIMQVPTGMRFGGWKGTHVSMLFIEFHLVLLKTLIQ